MPYKIKWRAGGEEPLTPQTFETVEQAKAHARLAINPKQTRSRRVSVVFSRIGSQNSAFSTAVETTTEKIRPR